MVVPKEWRWKGPGSWEHLIAMCDCVGVACVKNMCHVHVNYVGYVRVDCVVSMNTYMY